MTATPNQAIPRHHRPVQHRVRRGAGAAAAARCPTALAARPGRMSDPRWTGPAAAKEINAAAAIVKNGRHRPWLKIRAASSGDRMSTLENRYLGGNYAPVSAELTAHELPVTGSLPAALSGRYLRNGPNPLSRPSPPPTTGSPATVWCTASGSERAGPSGTETGGCARPRWPRRWASRSVPGRCTPTWISPRTPT